MQPHSSKRRRVVALLTVAAFAVHPAVAGAAQRIENPVHRSASFCIESVPPGEVSLVQARTLLGYALNQWNVPAGLDDGQGLSLTQDNPCTAATAVRVQAADLGPLQLAAVLDQGARIVMNSSKDWWDEAQNRHVGEWSYRGVLTHEMGHTLGIGHAGGAKWSWDGVAPTMVDGFATAEESNYAVSLQHDDAAMATFAATNRFWSPNPGFEDNLAMWRRTTSSSSVSIATAAGSASTGTRGARFATPGEGLTTASLYDPYHWDPASFGSSPIVAAGMTLTPTFGVDTHFRNPNGGALRGIKQSYEFRYLQYDATGLKVNAEATAVWSTWSARTLMDEQRSRDTAWHAMTSTVALPNNEENDATLFRPYAVSTTEDGGVVLADEIGITGGMS